MRGSKGWTLKKTSAKNAKLGKRVRVVEGRGDERAWDEGEGETAGMTSGRERRRERGDEKRVYFGVEVARNTDC